MGDWLRQSPDKQVQDKGRKMFHDLIRYKEHTSFFFGKSKQTKILLKAESVLCLGAEREGPTNSGQKQEEARGLEVTSSSWLRQLVMPSRPNEWLM